MPKLVDTETGRVVGTITDAQLDFLKDQLEEESPDDRDYWFDSAQIEALEENGGDATLIQTLRSALGDREEMELRWEA